MNTLANFWAALQPLLPIIGVGAIIAMAAWTVVTVRDINRAAEQRRAQRDAQAFVARVLHIRAELAAHEAIDREWAELNGDSA